MRSLYLFAAILIQPVAAQSIQLAFPNLSFDVPVNDIQAPDDGSNRLFVAEQDGEIKVFRNARDVTSAAVFLNLADRLNPAKGIIGFAFDPAYAQNGYLYVHYNRDHPDNGDPDFYQQVVSRFEVSEDADVADANSEEVLLVYDMRRAHHTGGQLQFGPDGYLYISVGNDVGPGDPDGHGQNVATLPASVLRLDVHGQGIALDCGTGAATIPISNPFVDGPGGACDELYAYGFRNPWRFSFDGSGRIWLADVGEDAWEEVNLVEMEGNYGWSTLEGTHCFDPPTGCDSSGTTLPVYEYPHDSSPTGGFSVIGGYSYDGNNCGPLLGKYVYGDFVTTNVWTLDYDGESVVNEVVESTSGLAMTTFGRDEQGEIYLADFATGKLSSLDCDQSLTVDLIPIGPTNIPASGGSITFDVTLENTTTSAQPFQAWATADLSDGTERVVISPVSAMLPANASVTRRVSLTVPARAPAGTSTVVVKVGGFPNTPASSSRFTVHKSSTSVAASLDDGAQRGFMWQSDSFSFETQPSLSVPTAIPSLEVFPVPAAERAVIGFVLHESADVRLIVYDAAGRTIETIINRGLQAGEHAIAFDASRLPSGVYFVRMQAGDLSQTQRLTVLR